MITLLRAWIGWTLSWTFYGPGLLMLHIMHRHDWTAQFLYGTSQALFNASSTVQDWGGGYGAWEDNFYAEGDENELNTKRYPEDKE